MPTSIFSETELARLASFPEEIPGDDLIRAFTLTGADRDLVAIPRRAANRLGLALQLCALRYLGFSMLRSRNLEELEAWLVERALEHDAPKVLFRLARERLRTERLVFPSPDRIVRLVSSARGRAQERTYTLVDPQVARAGCFWRGSCQVNWLPRDQATISSIQVWFYYRYLGAVSACDALT